MLSDQCACDVAEKREKYGGALPHNGRLAAEEIFQQKAVCMADIARIKLYRAVSQQHRSNRKDAQGFEKPAQQYAGGRAAT